MSGSIVNCPEKQLKAPFVRESVSTDAQQLTESECSPFFVDFGLLPRSQLDHLRETGLLDGLDVCLLREKHVQYLQQIWTPPSSSLRPSFVSLDASRTWMIFWNLHACDLLGHQPDTRQAIVATIRQCFTETTVELDCATVENDPVLSKLPSAASEDGTISFRAGGFGGGPGQMAHAATTYAAVSTLSILASSEPTAVQFLTEIRPKLYPWLVSLQQPDGSFRMHGGDGELDVRATYCVVAVANLLQMMTATLNSAKTARHVHMCQTWEGGFGGEPWVEAHGGYTYCAVAALQIMRRWSGVDLPSLTAWLARRQMSYEGGFNGRANKLVDGCYSLWQGGAMAIVSALQQDDGEEGSNDEDDPWMNSTTTSSPPLLLFDRAMLQRYILLCAQDVHGGLRDKPSKKRDFYHSCYCLSGLSISQHCDDDETAQYGHAARSSVAKTHPCYNIRVEHVQYVMEHFAEMPLSEKE